MKKGRKIKKIGTDKSHRVSLLKNLSSSLIMTEYMTTTRARARAFVPYFERVITLARPADINAKRRVISLIQNEKATDKIFDVLLKRFEDTKSGLVSVYKIGNRKGDNAEVVKLVLKGYEPPKKKTRIKEEKKKEQSEEKMLQKDEKGLSKETKLNMETDVKKSQEKTAEKVAEVRKELAKPEEPAGGNKKTIKKERRSENKSSKQNGSFFTKLFGFGKKDQQKTTVKGRARSRSGI
ncbi:50S ribosomal protein L17 [Candidatus Dojkabacteria bacterium]|nr:50S ribosomal protein L17 [Candidatus Dojkabacteria bacterium]